MTFEELCRLNILAVVRDDSGKALGLLCEDKDGNQYQVSMDEARQFQMDMLKFTMMTKNGHMLSE